MKPAMEIEDFVLAGGKSSRKKQSDWTAKIKCSSFILENKHTLVPSIAREIPEIFKNINTPKNL
jgi:hypothetical protein